MLYIRSFRPLAGYVGLQLFVIFEHCSSSISFRPLAGYVGLQLLVRLNQVTRFRRFRPLAGYVGLQLNYLHSIQLSPDKFSSPCGVCRFATLDD